MIDAELRAKLEAEKWFHAINFGDFSVQSSIYPPDRPPNCHLFPAFRLFSEISLEGHRCLDMGTFDGMTAFVLDQMGARQIDATCQYDLRRFRLAHEALAADRVIYHPKVQLEDLIGRFGEAAFDLVIMSVALHHVMLPLEALFICRQLLRRDGLFLLEAIAFESPEPTVYLNTELSDPVFGPLSIWIPTDAGLDGMLRLSSFDPLTRTDIPVPAESKMGGGGRQVIRSTILSKAALPANVRGRTAKLKDIHERKPWTGRIDYRALERPDWPESSIRYSGPEGPRPIDVRSFAPATPLQPRWTAPDG